MASSGDIATALETVRHCLTYGYSKPGTNAKAALSTIEADRKNLLTALEWANNEADRLRAERDEAVAALRARKAGHCGCAWCCASTPPEQRGEAHKQTCQPRLSTPKEPDA